MNTQLLELGGALSGVVGAIVRARESLPRRAGLGGVLAEIDRLTAASSFAERRQGGLGAAAVTAAAFALLSPRAFAEPLNPMEFPSLGNAVLVGALRLDTTTATLYGPSGAPLYQGSIHANHEAVLCFDNLTVASAAVIEIVGFRPVALLCRGAMEVHGVLDASGGSGTPWMTGGWTVGGVGVAGGGSGGIANEDGAAKGYGPGGGGGGWAPLGALTRAEPGNFGATASTPVSGVVYGDLFERLEGGSGGGGRRWVSMYHASGGAGGGAFELGAMVSITIINGGVIAEGGSADGGAGAGSGGGVLVHAPHVELDEGTISVRGGSASGESRPGGGGRVTVQGFPLLMGQVDVRGGHNANEATSGPAGVLKIVQPQVQGTDVDFGPVRLGESRTLLMGLTNASSVDSRICGQFPAASGAFARTGEAIFAGVRKGRTAACAYQFTPGGLGAFSQTVTVLTDAGPVQVTLRGEGTNGCGTADFNGDGDVGTDQDIEAFFRVLGGGSC